MLVGPVPATARNGRAERRVLRDCPSTAKRTPRRRNREACPTPTLRVSVARILSTTTPVSGAKAGCKHPILPAFQLHGPHEVTGESAPCQAVASALTLRFSPVRPRCHPQPRVEDPTAPVSRRIDD